MDPRFLIVGALLKLGGSIPAPGPNNINIQILQEVNSGCCNGGCPCKPTKKPPVLPIVTCPEPDCECGPGYEIVTTQGIDGCLICECELLRCDEENIQANILRNESTTLNLNITSRGRGASLAFVFDTTGSMGPDLSLFKDVAGQILDAALAKSGTIQNFILVEFNDPNVGPLTVTTNPTVFQTSLDSIVVKGGGDCPEMVLGGIIMALNAVLPNSFVYVFTDASAKDCYKLDQVLNLMQDKQAQITILLTGNNCNDYDDYIDYYECEDFDITWESISSYSSGLVFEIEKNDITEILKHVNSSVGEEKANLVSVEYDAGTNEFEVLVDNTLKVLTISVSGTNIVIQIIGPDGEDFDALGRIEVIVDLANVKIVGVTDPKPGRYDITVSSDTEYTVRATGDSYISFEHGFSIMPTANFSETSRRPTIGVIAYIIVKPKDLTDFGDTYRIQLINLNGTILYDSSLKLIPGYNAIYTGTSFIAPNEIFNIKIFGCDLSGSEFERISASAISAQSLNSTIEGSERRAFRPVEVYYNLTENHNKDSAFEWQY